MGLNIAVTIPWFGKELTGGAESLAYQLAQRLAEQGHQLTILTTLSQSHADFFGADLWPTGELSETTEGLVRVFRFPVEPRNPKKFHKQNRILMSLSSGQLTPGVSPLHSEDEYIFWQNNLRSAELTSYIETHREGFDFFLFLPYPFTLVMDGVKAAGDKALLQPCLHDESYAYLNDMADCFLSASKLLFNSKGEREVACKLYGPGILSKSVIVGSGVEVDLEALDSAPKPAIEGPYVLYLGKRDRAKNVDQLLLAYQEYRKKGGRLKLVLAGVGDLPEQVADVVDLGRVDEQQKISLLRHATGLINPSLNESFSRVVFESWLAKRPVVVNRRCAATYGFFRDALEAGFAFEGEAELTDILFYLEKADPEQLAAAGQRGFEFAQRFALWDGVIQNYERLFDEERQKRETQTKPNHPKGRVVQLLPNLSMYDAIGNQTRYMSGLLQKLGYESVILADHRPKALRQEAQLFKPTLVEQTDLLILHHSMGSKAQVDCFKAHQGRKVLLYHNITPDHFFRPYDPIKADRLAQGRLELAALAEEVPLALGDSEYNRAELVELGFSKTGVLPLVVDPESWHLKPDLTVAQKLQKKGGKQLLFVGRLAPNKGQTDLVELIFYLRQIRPEIHLWLVGEPEVPAYVEELQTLIDRYGLAENITLVGQVDQPELMAYFQGADLFVSMSEHEGFGIPLIEAMWFDLPVLAYQSSAVKETLGKAGFVFEDKGNLSQLAREVEVILSEPQIRERMIRLQRQTRERFLPETLQDRYKFFFDPPERTSKPTLAFVVQRCGDEVVGGAESLCLQTARQLSARAKVDILCSCAKDYVTWEDHYPPGVQVLSDSLRILRFPVSQPRDIKSFDQFTAKIFRGYTPGEVQLVDKHTGEEWLRQQGPEVPGLVEYLQTHHREYETVFLFGYLYYQSYFSSHVCPEKTWLVALAHDEPLIYLSFFDQLFAQVKGVIHNTPGELEILRRRFSYLDFQEAFVGTGLNQPTEPPDPQRFLDKHQLTEPFILYLGRIEPSKGSDLLFDYFIRYKKQTDQPLKLVLVGKTEVEIPQHPDICYLGFVEEQEKKDGLAACEFLVNPSPFESLSMVLLEAWSVKKPVLVNGHCSVMVDQTKRAGGGAAFTDYQSFQTELDQLLTQDLDLTQAQRFVEAHYAWPAVLDRYLQINALGKLGRAELA